MPVTTGTGDEAQDISNIKTPAPATKRRTATKLVTKTVATRTRAASRTLRTSLHPRYLVHGGLVVASLALVLSNSAANTHAVSVRLMSAQAGVAATSLDDAGVASVAADMADASGLLVANTATKTASTMNQQVALLTADDDALAKRQVVSTAGNPTRDVTSYAVQPGDTLSGIAAQFNITTSTILWANDLSDEDMVKPGQALTILPVSGLIYTVKDGDTADSLASAYSANAAQILSFNNAEVTGLKSGMKIIIPDGVKPQPVKAAPTQIASSNSSGRVAGASTYVHLTPYYGSANGYSYGYCTWYVASRRSVPSNWGNANQWYYNAQASGFSVGSTPVPGAIAWTGAGYYGHVAYVESVSGGMVTVSEMNYNGNWGRVTSRTVPASSFRYIY